MRSRRSRAERRPDGRENARARRHRRDQAHPRSAPEDAHRRLRRLRRRRRRDGDDGGGRGRVLHEGRTALGARARHRRRQRPARSARARDCTLGQRRRDGRARRARARRADRRFVRGDLPRVGGHALPRGVVRARRSGVAALGAWSRPRAFDELALAQADTRELGELYRLGAACGEAIAAPLVADGQALGAVLVALPASVEARATRSSSPRSPTSPPSRSRASADWR